MAVLARGQRAFPEYGHRDRIAFATAIAEYALAGPRDGPHLGVEGTAQLRGVAQRCVFRFGAEVAVAIFALHAVSRSDRIPNHLDMPRGCSVRREEFACWSGV